MDPRRTRMMFAVGGMVVAVAAVVLLVRASSIPVVRDGGADASTGTRRDVDAETEASPLTNVNEGSLAPSDPAPAHPAASTPARSEAGAIAIEPQVVGVVGRGADGGSGDAGALKANAVTLDEGSEGKTVELAIGQKLVVLLAASPTSGFDWSVMRAPSALGSPEMGFIPGGDQMGAPGKRRLTWTLKSALPDGDHAVELGYARSFEKGVAPFKTFKLKVRAAH